MTKIFTFKKRKDFLRVASSFYVATHNMVLQAALSLSQDNDFWVGYTATKKVGNAVRRNKSKRRLRAIAREVLIQYGLSYVDYVFVARNTTSYCHFDDLKNDVIYAINKINKNFITSSTGSFENSEMVNP